MASTSPNVQKSGFAIANDFRNSADAKGHDRSRVKKRFKNAKPETFRLRSVETGVGGAEDNPPPR